MNIASGNSSPRRSPSPHAGRRPCACASSSGFKTVGQIRVTGRARWSLVGWDEFLLTMDETRSGPAQGIDQNRLFVGTLRQFSPKVGFEFGYLWVTSEPPASPRTHAHNLSVWLNLTP